MPESPLLGYVGSGSHQPIKDTCLNFDGTTRILKERCHNCPYRPNSSFSPQLKRINKEAKETKGFNICHNTFPSDVLLSVCSGSFEAFNKQFDWKGTPDFIEEPKSSYIVLPMNNGFR